MSDFDLDDLEFEYDLEFDDLPLSGNGAPTFRLRDYQVETLDKIEAAWAEHSRILIALATGCGKTVVFSEETRREVARGGRVLILAHTDELLEQAIDKLHRSTGIMAEKEKADSHASPFAPVVVASVQTLSRINRLTGFGDNHFTLVIVDESHRILAASYLKVVNYFHFGAHSLDEGWKMPEPGEAYEHKARVLGVTATPDRGDRRSLGEFFQACVQDYGLLQAVRDGYLVRPITHNVPLQIDLRGVKSSRTANGSDYDVRDVVERITPFIAEVARQLQIAASDRKTVVFMPSISTAKMGAEASAQLGMEASFVSGACPDRKEKLDAFDRAGAGSIIYNAMLLTEGWDCPDVSCICVLRPTKIRALYVQCVGRGTRPLPGIIDGILSPEERVMAIHNSQKPDLRIIDFLWLSDRLDLVKPIDLVASSVQIRDRMMADGGATDKPVDLVDLEQAANRDLLKSLEKAAKEHSRKSARVIDPLGWAVSIGDADLANYEPTMKNELRPPTEGQLESLARNGIDVTKVTTFGFAAQLMDRVVKRSRLGLCTVKQLNFLRTLGVPEDKANLLTFTEAHAVIDELTAKRNQRPSAPSRATA